MTALSPNVGAIGSRITITGTSLRGATEVTFNGTRVGGFSMNSAGTSMSVTVPVGTTSGPVVVTAPHGVSNGLPFTVGPSITRLTPAFGGPGTPVTITGQNFLGATAVAFNGTPAPGYSVSADGMAITVSAPVGVTTGPVLVTSPIGTSNGVLYTAAPLITTFSPDSGPIGTSVTIIGTDLHGATQVLFNGVVANTFTIISSSRIEALVPQGATRGLIKVVTPRGTATSSTTFLPPAPTLTALSPGAGAEGASITLTGTGLLGSTGITFQGTTAPGFTINAAGTTATVRVPAGATSGMVQVLVPLGSSNELPFTVLPAITGITPARAPVGARVTVVGTSFRDVTSVSFNGVLAPGYTVLSPTQLEVMVPPGAVSGTVRVTTIDGLSNAYPFAVPPTLTARAPQLNAVGIPGSVNFNLTFSRAMNATAASVQAIRMHGRQQSRLSAGTFSGSGTATVTYNPAYDLRAGETAHISVTTAAQAGDGTSLAKPFVYQVTAATAPAPATFTGDTYTLASEAVSGIHATDMDSDGFMDLAYSFETLAWTQVSYFNGSVFNSINGAAGASKFITSADLDNDGHRDYVVATSGSANEITLFRNINFFRNFNRWDWLPVPVAGSTATGGLRTIVPADLNGDGNIDLLVACVGAGTSVSLGQGNGRFLPYTTLATGHTESVAAGDIDGDGDLDVIACSRLTNTVVIRLNDGTGTFSEGSSVSVGGSPVAVALGDLNGDSALDMVVANYELSAGRSTVSVLLNSGTGAFTNSAAVPVGARAVDVKLGDVDGDGDLDFVSSNQASNNVSICLNNGQGSFMLARNHPVKGSPAGLDLADIDGNGTLDLVTTGSLGAHVYLNKASVFVWTGTVSSDWNTAGNWQGNAVPTRSDDASIPAGLTTYPVVDQGSIAVHSLTIAAGAQFTLQAAATVEVFGNWQNHGATTLPGAVVFRGTAFKRSAAPR
nr:FG-GAP-like repeat-containing protein [Hymenobacter sp. HDW8]